MPCPTIPERARPLARSLQNPDTTEYCLDRKGNCINLDYHKYGFVDKEEEEENRLMSENQEASVQIDSPWLYFERQQTSLKSQLARLKAPGHNARRLDGEQMERDLLVVNNILNNRDVAAAKTALLKDAAYWENGISKTKDEMLKGYSDDNKYQSLKEDLLDWEAKSGRQAVIRKKWLKGEMAKLERGKAVDRLSFYSKEKQHLESLINMLPKEAVRALPPLPPATSPLERLKQKVFRK